MWNPPTADGAAASPERQDGLDLASDLGEGQPFF